jgi:Rieske Fe-S protein
MMTRRDFIAKSCLACAGGSLLSLSLSGCATHHVTGMLEQSGVSISTSEFVQIKNKATTYRTYLIVQHEQLEFPIYLYRFSETEYTALWMECTHQGAELQASGDFLHCPSHGSEFTNRGTISSGPAEKNLRSFPVSVMNDKILIDLRA